MQDREQKIEHIKKYLQQVPEENRRVIALLMRHCFVIQKNEEENKMTPRNLATVLSPTLLYSNNPNVTSMVSTMPMHRITV
jgi:hypothetical protein